MTATYTVDLFSSLDGFGSFSEHGDWGGYWGKQGPELLARRLDVYREPCRMVFGATTFREMSHWLVTLGADSEFFDPWVVAMREHPTTVFSSSLTESLPWPNAEVSAENAVTALAALKRDSPVPLRSHGSLSLNRALLAAGLVDELRVTVFPVLTGNTGTEPLFEGAADFDLELIEARTLDGHTQELTYRPTLHVSTALHVSTPRQAS
ncbi:dihydrofolate reductase family protein [Micrococcales bacterium 31B]|nr:dihydrofolate reductase family protein [Micrococcales bacterium 31B]